jgi:hypothetical protein
VDEFGRHRIHEDLDLDRVTGATRGEPVGHQVALGERLQKARQQAWLGISGEDEANGAQGRRGIGVGKQGGGHGRTPDRWNEHARAAVSDSRAGNSFGPGPIAHHSSVSCHVGLGQFAPDLFAPDLTRHDPRGSRACGRVIGARAFRPPRSGR